MPQTPPEPRVTRSAAARPVPDRDSVPWWAAVRRHELLVQECVGCGTLRFPPREYCPACRTRDWAWRRTDGGGTVAAWIVNHRGFHPDLEPPYTVVMVRLAQAPGCVLYGGWRADREPRPGEPVTAVFADVDEELTLIDWTPRGSS